MNNQQHEQHMYTKRNNNNTLIKAFFKFFYAGMIEFFWLDIRSFEN